jgi:hypothetical protein
MRVLWMGSVCGIAVGATNAGMILGPSEYLEAADSPFSGRAGWALEDFEDLQLDLLGVSADVGAPYGPASNADSVDGDDGVIDGFGRDGRSFFFGNGATGITFTFDAAAIGTAPVAAGIVWTDGGGEITFEAYDTQGNLIGTASGMHATGGNGGETDEDRFYGVEHAGGIGSIVIRNSSGGIEVVHLQYVVPAPFGGAALLGGLVMAARRRR